MTVSPSDIVNRAVQLIGGYDNNAPITGDPPTFDDSVIGLAAGAVYDAVVQTVGRQHGWDFSRAVVALEETDNTAPLPWAFEYLYPTNGVEVRQLIPAADSDEDPNNPRPINWTVGNASVDDVVKKVIWSNEADAQAYFSNQPAPTLWDALFAEAVVRLLASEIALAVPGKPETARDTLTQSAQFEQLGEGRDG